MCVLGLSMTVVLILTSSAVSAERADGSDKAVQAMLDRVGKMGSLEQQAWLRRLEERAARAARLVLKPDETAQQQATIRSQLHQKVVTWQILRQVIEQTDTREQNAIDQLVRRYRRLVFDAFHTQIDVYNQRQQAWLDVYLGWKLAGGQFEQQDRLIDWLEGAIRSATPETIGPIPEKPKFESGPAADVAPKQPAEAAKPQAATNRHGGS